MVPIFWSSQLKVLVILNITCRLKLENYRMPVLKITWNDFKHIDSIVAEFSIYLQLPYFQIIHMVYVANWNKFSWISCTGIIVCCPLIYFW